ncbi:MAG: Rrf2 family transcriptional regulator [Spirochaetes bacterium]|nr:Rrf2 family transcriptional regulator [Spirochaetota bacterium]
MKLLTRNTDYAVRALSYIAMEKGKTVTAAELSEELKISWSFLRKILQILSREGLVFSIKGKGGGFKLAQPADRIFLLDLINIFQGLVRLNTCITNNKACPNIRICILKKKIDIIEDSIISELHPITLKTLLNEQNDVIQNELLNMQTR